MAIPRNDDDYTDEFEDSPVYGDDSDCWDDDIDDP